MSKNWKKHLGWLVSVAFLWLIFRKLDWHEFLTAVSRVSPVEILALVALYLIGFSLRGLRSRLLLPHADMNIALAGVFIGYAANNLLPARLGEIVRAHVIGKKLGIRRTLVFSSVIVERIFDGFIIVLLLIVGSMGLKLTPELEKLRLFGLLLFSGALGGLILIGFSFRYWHHHMPESRAGQHLKSLFEGVELACRSPLVFFGILAYSGAVWSFETLMFMYGFHMFDISVPALAAFFVLGVVNLGVLIPSSPGNLGVFQFFTVMALKVYGVPESTATAYSFAIHVCQFLPVVIIGSVYLHRLGFRSFFEMKDQELASQAS